MFATTLVLSGCGTVTDIFGMQSAWTEVKTTGLAPGTACRLAAWRVENGLARCPAGSSGRIVTTASSFRNEEGRLREVCAAQVVCAQTGPHFKTRY